MSGGGGGLDLPVHRTMLRSFSPLSMSIAHTVTVFTFKPKEFHNVVPQCLLCIDSVKCINHIKHGLLTSSVKWIFPPELEHCAQMPSASEGRLTKLIQVCCLRVVEHYVFLRLPKLHPIFKITLSVSTLVFIYWACNVCQKRSLTNRWPDTEAWLQWSTPVIPSLGKEKQGATHMKPV